LPYCREEKGGKYDQFAKSHFDRRDLRALADATQRLYLGLGSFYEWAEEQKKAVPSGILPDWARAKREELEKPNDYREQYYPIQRLL